MTKYKIRPFDISSASREEWSKFHKFRRKRTAEVHPDDPVEDDSGYEAGLPPYLKEFEIKSYAVTMNDNPSEIVAWLQMHVFKDTSSSYAGNEHLVQLRSMSVVKEQRRKKIGGDLLKLVHKFAVEKGKRLVTGYTSEEDGRAFIRLVGGTEALDIRSNRLNLDEVDWNLVENWAHDGAEKSPDASLDFFTTIPDEILEDYCKMYTEVMNQAPLDDLEIGDYIVTPDIWRQYEESAANAGQTWFTAMIREKNGDISGLSDVFYIPSISPLMVQQLTGVVENYRGQGKGKWIKAALLLKIREKFPDIKTISTGNATSNAPMLSINERLGFKLYKEGFSVQIETKKLGEYLVKK